MSASCWQPTFAEVGFLASPEDIGAWCGLRGRLESWEGQSIWAFTIMSGLGRGATFYMRVGASVSEVVAMAELKRSQYGRAEVTVAV